MKKFLVSAAAVAALATSAMAFDVYPSNEVQSYDFNETINAKDGILKPLNSTQGEALIYPLFYVGNGWQSQIRVINTSNEATVAKVVFYSAKDSKELKDFNIYLSGNDEWIGKVVEENGKYYIESTDGSTPLKGTAQNPYPMASADNPFKLELPEGVGYVQIIDMANVAANINGNVDLTLHGQHAKIREAYTKIANKIRATDNNGANFTFSNGVILNKAAIAPFVDLNNPYNAYTDTDGNAFELYTYYKDGDLILTNKNLTGDVRVTNTINGTDMVYPAKTFEYYEDSESDNTALIYVEGEKANLADIDINGSNGQADEYNNTALIKNLEAMSASTVWMTYGDTQDVSRNYALLTIPFKRMIVQEALKAGKTNVVDPDNTNQVLFYGIKYDSATNEITYGSVQLLAKIFNNDESMMSAGQFSPATTPTIILANEVSSTGTDVNDASKLPYYLKQAQTNGYTNGYVVLTNKSDNGAVIPGIVTQMIATDAGNAVVTNWFTPAQD